MRKQNNRSLLFYVTIVCVFVLQLGEPGAYGQEQQVLTWKAAITTVLEQNPNLASAEDNLKAAETNIAIARSNYLPGLNLLGSLSKSKTATFSEFNGVIPSSAFLAGASLSQMVYSEKSVANIKVQKYLYASKEEQFRDTQYNIISSAGMSYIALLLAEDLLAVQKENIQITEYNLNAASDRYKAGSTNMQEVLRWKTQMFSDRQSIESQKAVVIIRRGGLNQLLNTPIETRNVLEKLTLENNGFIFSSSVVAAEAADEKKAIIIRDYLVELGLGNSPALAGIDQQLLAQNRQLVANRRWAIPNINASATGNANFDLSADEVASSDRGFWKVGLTMNIPIVDGGGNINRIRQSKWQLSSMELQRNNVKTSLEQSIRSSVAVVISDFINIGYAGSQVEAADKNYELVNGAYNAGESTLLELLDAKNQKLVADISSRVALYTFLADLLSVEYAIGYFPFLQPVENEQAIIKELEHRLLEIQ